MITHNGKCDFKLLQSIKNFYTNKTDIIQDDDNILIKYLKSPEIIRDFKTNNLSLFIKELLNQIEISNIILPFIDPISDLIDIYLNTTDNKITKDEWDKLFTKLIEKSFFNRENLIPIYSYFTELYSEIDEEKISDEKLQKFKKYADLWELIYLNITNNTKLNTVTSTICLLGSGIELFLPSIFPQDLGLNINITLLDDNFLDCVNPNDYFIQADNVFFLYRDLINGCQHKKIKYFQFKYSYEESNKKLWFCVNNNDFQNKLYLFPFSSKVILLGNFFGQISDIKISFYDYTLKESYSKKTIYPNPIKDNGIIFMSGYEVKMKENDELMKINYDIYNASSEIIIDKEAINPKDGYLRFNIELKVQDKNLVKCNFINYKQEFNIINYFGRIIQFLPFLNIINGLYNNKKISLIDNRDKIDFLFDFTKNILKVIFNYFNNETPGNLKSLEKYWTFFLYIINKIDLLKSAKIKFDMEEFIPKPNNNNIYINVMILFLEYINSKSENDMLKLEELVRKNYFIAKGENNFMNLSLFWKTNSQLYRHIMKQLFVYNRFWSRQYLFFDNVHKVYQKYNKKEVNPEIKYKRINYYTSNFQQPLIYPILEIKNYIPDIKKFKNENIYKNQTENKILNYDFSISKFPNILHETFIKNYLDNNNKDLNNAFRCCLVKKLYHVQGRLGWVYYNNDKNSKNNKINKNKNNDEQAHFAFYFLSDLQFSGDKCNKVDKSDLCYGSLLPFVKKENNRIIYIPREKIVFALIRIYYQRISGLEIFTTNNKSYYFNFKEEYKIPKDEKCKNSILNFFKKYFMPIIRNKSKDISGWYNPKFEKIYFPLFSENIDIWKEKNIYSNFDKLMIINLFSNRSFNDLNQYPVFPMIYNEIKLKREMDKPIGFQEINKDSETRTKLIKDSYYTEKEYNEDGSTEISYFSILFSNISFVCNYLIRVYPYSFIAIELQGDRFDTPDRLFFSIDSTMHNTLTQRSDLRELIPEMFYFPPLFSNINNIELGKLRDGSNIDNVIIHNKNENKIEKYMFLKRMKDSLEAEENLNLWIDKIFGIYKEFDENNERYYSSNNNIDFISKPQITNDNLMLQSCDFGVLPYKLFTNKFPAQNKIAQETESKIKNHNYNQFLSDHIECLYDEKISFMCKGEKGINSVYLKLINKNDYYFFGLADWYYFRYKNYNNEVVYYLFTGDVFGILSVYIRVAEINKKNNINEEFREMCSDKNFCEDIYNQNYILLNKIVEHTKEIIYIDYNPRLNLLADYSLDGFINIYSMPSLKLIRAIQTKDYNIKGEIKKIALVSTPFPMICISSDLQVFVLDINGEFIKNFDVNKGNIIEFCVDKNCGRVNDYIVFIDNKKMELRDIL